MFYILLIPAVWVVLLAITLVSWHRDRVRYPPSLIKRSEPTDSDNIYTRHEQYNRYDSTQYN